MCTAYSTHSSIAEEGKKSSGEEERRSAPLVLENKCSQRREVTRAATRSDSRRSMSTRSSSVEEEKKNPKSEAPAQRGSKEGCRDEALKIGAERCVRCVCVGGREAESPLAI